VRLIIVGDGKTLLERAIADRMNPYIDLTAGTERLSILSISPMRRPWDNWTCAT
jgi:hypothetical protein